MPELYDRARLAGAPEPDVDEIAFGCPAMTTRWRSERDNAVRQLELTQAELAAVAASPEAYGPDHAARLERTIRSWRILIADYCRYLGEELSGGPPVTEQGGLF